MSFATHRQTIHHHERSRGTPCDIDRQAAPRPLPACCCWPPATGATADGFETTISATDPTADRTVTLPDASGTVALTSDIPATASAIASSATGDVAATTVQGAIAELASEKVATTRSVATGTGLTGGGSLAADRSLALDVNGMSAETSADDADTIAIYDNSTGVHRKMTRADFLAGVGSGGSTTTVLTGASVTLPASPSAGDLVIVANNGGMTVNGNGKTIYYNSGLTLLSGPSVDTSATSTLVLCVYGGTDWYMVASY